MFSTAARRIAGSDEQIDPNLYCGSVKRFGLIAPIRIPLAPACRCRSAQKASLEISKVERTYRPEPRKAKIYRERFARYKELYPALKNWLHSI